ncbi:MAG TPA: ATP-binding cassette domain-containing protein [Alphaproteobacteria bacterium]|nr:ATP-binding cassette domain-containing protein [Alphaproteobacteria bacterium]
MADQPRIAVKNMDMAYGSFVLQRDLNFAIAPGEIFFIMGGSGCGKSTLLKQMIGLKPPAKGDVHYDGAAFWRSQGEERQKMMRRFGVLYQSGALWSSMTLAENVALPIAEYTDLAPGDVRELSSLKLSLVGLAGFEDYYPAEISGGMRKRAGLARAMALDPDILFFDEPSAGLDPISSKRLDDLILELRDSLRATVVIVSHELASIFAIGDNSVFLDAESKTMIAQGNPRQMLQDNDDPRVRAFLNRNEEPDTERAI